MRLYKQFLDHKDNVQATLDSVLSDETRGPRLRTYCDFFRPEGTLHVSKWGSYCLFSAHFRTMLPHSCFIGTLDSLLTRPAQRLPRYSLLLRELLKQMDVEREKEEAARADTSGDPTLLPFDASNSGAGGSASEILTSEFVVSPRRGRSNARGGSMLPADALAAVKVKHRENVRRAIEEVSKVRYFQTVKV